MLRLVIIYVRVGLMFGCCGVCNVFIVLVVDFIVCRWMLWCLSMCFSCWCCSGL